jgi:hypothetical protein
MKGAEAGMWILGWTRAGPVGLEVPGNDRTTPGQRVASNYCIPVENALGWSGND